MLVRPEHQVAYEDLAELLRKHADSVTKEELLAIAANMLGKIVALQDQRITSRERALEIVGRNIELGNAEMIELVNQADPKAPT